MKGGVSIAAEVLFIVYVFLSFPETTSNSIAGIEFYTNLAITSVFIHMIYPLEFYFLHGPKGLLKANVLVATSVIYWLLLDIIQGSIDLDVVTPSAVRTAFIAISVFVISVQVSSNISLSFPRIVRNAAKFSLPHQTIFIMVLVCFVVGVFYFFKSAHYDFNYMLNSMTKSRWRAPWARGVAGGTDAIIEHLKYFGYLLPPLSALYLLQKKRFDLQVAIVFFLTIFFCAFEFQGGGRRIIGFLAGSFLMTILIYLREKLKVIHFVIVGVLGIGMLFLLDMQFHFRNVGYSNMLDKYDFTEIQEIKVDDNFLRLCQIIDLIPADFPHSGFEYLAWTFSRPIPRALWPNKPLGPGFDVAMMVGARGVSLTSTVVGESYASLGFIMIIIVGCIFGFVASLANGLLDQQVGVFGVALYSISALALVAGVRSLPDLIIFSYAFGGLVLIYRYYFKNKPLTS